MSNHQGQNSVVNAVLRMYSLPQEQGHAWGNVELDSWIREGSAEGLGLF